MNPTTNRRTYTFVEAKVGRGKFLVEGVGIITGNGIVVNIFGGEQSHIGAIVLAIPRSSLVDPGETSATSSVLTLTGHKDDHIARPAAEMIARKMGFPVVATVGVHVDNATVKDIDRLVSNSKKVIRKLLFKMDGIVHLSESTKET